jgi:hypothetical protein
MSLVNYSKPLKELEKRIESCDFPSASGGPPGGTHEISPLSRLNITSRKRRKE